MTNLSATIFLTTSFLIFTSESPCDYLRFVARPEWHSMKDLTSPFETVPVFRVFIHATFTHSCFNLSDCKRRVKDIETKHVEKFKWDDIGYHFLIGGDGRVYIGRGWGFRGAHTHDYNDDIGIAFIGDFKVMLPSSVMLYACHKLIRCGITNGQIKRRYSVYGHRDVDDVDCPGDSLYKEVKKWSHFKAAEKEKIYHDRLLELFY